MNLPISSNLCRGRDGAKREIGDGYSRREATISTPGGRTTIYRLSDFRFFAVLNELMPLQEMNTVSVVADLRTGPTGGFLGLNRTATVLLETFLQCGEEGITQLAAFFGVPVMRVQDDLRSLLARLKLEGMAKRAFRSRVARVVSPCLLLPARYLAHLAVRKYRPSQDMKSSIRLSAVRILLRLVWISLRVFGWQATMSLLTRFHCDHPLADAASGRAIVEAVDEAVRHAAAGLLIPIKCAERGIVAYQILRAGFGQPATLVVCYRPCPRGFHCYVESTGITLTDKENHRATFLPVACFT